MYYRGERSATADECECRYLLTTVGEFGQLALEEVDVGLEAVSGPHLDKEEVMVVGPRVHSPVLF